MSAPRRPKPLRLKPERPSEAQIQSAVMRRLRVAGFLVVRVNSGGFKDATGRFVKGYIVQGLNSCSGFPDVLALKGSSNGSVKALLIELKDHKNKLTDSQERFSEYAAHFGVAVHVVRHPDELDALLEKIEES